MLPNNYPSDGIFSLHQRTIIDYFFCILLFRKITIDLNMCCFIKLFKTAFFDQDKIGMAFSYTLTVGWKLTCKLRRRQNRHADIIYEQSYTPQVRRHVLAPVGFMDIPVGLARKMFVYTLNWSVRRSSYRKS